MLQLAKRKFVAHQRKTGRSLKFDKTVVAAALQRIELTKTDTAGRQVPIKYLVGWTLIPPNMMGGGHKNFMPVDALDGAACRGTPGMLMLFRGVV